MKNLAMYELEICWDCDGDGEGCETCAETGELFTDAAIKLQIEADETAEATA